MAIQNLRVVDARSSSEAATRYSSHTHNKIIIFPDSVNDSSIVSRIAMSGNDNSRAYAMIRQTFLWSCYLILHLEKDLLS